MDIKTNDEILILREMKTINVIITYPDKLSIGGKSTKILALPRNRILNDIFKDFLRSNPFIKLQKKDYYFYLIKKNENIMLPKNEIISKIGLKNGDEIILSYEKIPTKINILPDNLPKRKIINRNNKKIKKILLLLLLFLSIVMTIILLYIFLRGNGNYGDNYLSEKNLLIIDKKYPPNKFIRFSGKRKVEINANGDNISEKNSSYIMTQKSDFFLIVREGNIEIDEKKNLKREWYTGYIGFLNVTFNNNTHDMMSIYDKTINNILYKYNISRLDEPDLKNIGNKGNICFIKLDFYQNGDLKNIYLPNGFQIDNLNLIEDIIKLIITKISANLYSNSIDDEIKKAFPDNNENEDLNEYENEFKNEEENEENEENGENNEAEEEIQKNVKIIDI